MTRVPYFVFRLRPPRPPQIAGSFEAYREARTAVREMRRALGRDDPVTGADGVRGERGAGRAAPDRASRAASPRRGRMSRSGRRAHGGRRGRGRRRGGASGVGVARQFAWRAPGPAGRDEDQSMAEYDQELDACGLSCPLPILRAKKALTRMARGQVLRIIADRPRVGEGLRSVLAPDRKRAAGVDRGWRQVLLPTEEGVAFPPPEEGVAFIPHGLVGGWSRPRLPSRRRPAPLHATDPARQ